MALRDIPQAAIDLIRSFEGIPDGDPSTVNIDPYIDPVGIWTIGWGHAIRANGQYLRGESDRHEVKVLYPEGITMDQAVALLQADLMDTGRDVLAAVVVPLNDNEFSALLSFTFNLGVGNLRSSTLLRMLNADDRAGAAEQFPRWNRAGGRELLGLTRRRNAERALFLQPA